MLLKIKFIKQISSNITKNIKRPAFDKKIYMFNDKNLNSVKPLSMFLAKMHIF